MWENNNVRKDEFDEAINRLVFLGSIALSTQPKQFNEDSFIGAHNILTLSKLLNQLGFSEHYMLIGSNSIYTENTQLIRFCKKYSIPLKVYHNYTSEKIEL